MKLGKYDQKIQFGNEGQVSDGAGGFIPGENLLLNTFARIEQLRQSQSIEQVQKRLPSTYRVGVQVRAGFEPAKSMWVKWRGQKYDIITAPVVENLRMQKEWIFDMTCQ